MFEEDENNPPGDELFIAEFPPNRPPPELLELLPPNRPPPELPPNSPPELEDDPPPKGFELDPPNRPDPEAEEPKAELVLWLLIFSLL